MFRAILAVLALGGCASSAGVFPRPDGGYAGLVALEEIRLPNGAPGGWLQLDAGARLIADRALPDGEPLYCGEMVIGDAIFGRSTPGRQACFALRGNALVSNADRGGGAHTTNPIPPGSLRAFRLN